MASVGAVLDLTADALPVHLERVVALDDRLQLEALARVPDLLAPQDVDAAVDVFARDARLDLLEAQKILLVERAQPFEANLELFQRDVELLGRHGASVGERSHE
jgi:hypothetical protein